MKDDYKKPTWLWLLLCLPAVFIIYFAVSLSDGNIDPGDVGAVEVTAATGEKYTFEKDGDIAFYVDLYLEADKLPEPVRDIEGEKPLDVVIKQKNGSTHFELFAEANTNGCFYRSDEGFYFSVPSDFAKRLLQRKECESVYKRAGHTLPQLFFVTGTEESPILPKKYKWQYKDIAGVPVDDTQSEKESKPQFFSFYPNMGFSPRFSVQPGEYTISFTDESGKPLDVTDPRDLFFVTDTKLHTVITAKWQESETALGGNAVYEFDLLYDVLPEVICSDESVTVGDILRISFIHLNENEEISLKTELVTSKMRVRYGESGSAFALMPVSAENAAGEYSLVFTVGSIEKTVTLSVNAPEKKFNVVTMDTEKYARFVQPDYKQRFAELSDKWESTEAWTDPDGGQLQSLNANHFSKPSEGRVIYDFGTELCINGIAHKYIVDGIDYRLDKGDAVKSTQRGKVAYIGEDEVYGNILVIDHGYGIKSHYYGLGAATKKVGDIVQKEEIIGSADVSGLVYTEDSAKIPTLHFFVTLNGVRVNPNTLYEKGVMTAE